MAELYSSVCVCACVCVCVCVLGQGGVTASLLRLYILYSQAFLSNSSKPFWVES